MHAFGFTRDFSWLVAEIDRLLFKFQRKRCMNSPLISYARNAEWTNNDG
jgi:hypothetical protein